MKRYFLLSSWSDLKDSNRGYDGNVQIILQATIRNNKLTGKVYIFPHKWIPFLIYKIPEKWLLFFNKKQDKEIVNLIQLIIEAKSLTKAKENVEKIYTEIEDNLKSIKKELFYSIDFTVDMFGFIELSIDNSQFSLSKKFRDKLNPKISILLAKQSFYFIKYSLHKHQHHSSDVDCIVTIHEYKDDETNAKNMLNDLKSNLVKTKRDFSLTKHYCLFDAKGIAAYAKSLLESCKATGKLKNNEIYEREVNYLNNISESLSNKAENIERIFKRGESISNLFRSLIIFCLSILTPVIFIYQKEIKNRISLVNSSIEELNTNSMSDFDFVIQFIAYFYSKPVYMLLLGIAVFFIFWLVRRSVKQGWVSPWRHILQGIKTILKKKDVTKNVLVVVFIVSIIFFVYYLGS